MYWGQTAGLEQGNPFPLWAEGQDQVGGADERPSWALLSLCEFASLKTALCSLRGLETPRIGPGLFYSLETSSPGESLDDGRGRR